MTFHGLIAAGGVASRLGAIPCSKEIFPLRKQFASNRIKELKENKKLRKVFLMEQSGNYMWVILLLQPLRQD